MKVIQNKNSTKFQKASIRVSSTTYGAAIFLATFFSGLAVYFDYFYFGFGLLFLTWLLMPFLALTDRLKFDGKRIARTGYLPVLWAGINHFRSRLKISDVEQVETHAIPAVKRGGRVLYRYRTSISGKGVNFTFVSGGVQYRDMIRAIFPLLPENVMDNRSLELRDYVSEPAETSIRAVSSNIPPADVLENSLSRVDIKNKRATVDRSSAEIMEDADKAVGLRKLANELRLSGSLLQALEAFRRALILRPQDAWLLFEFARCIQSFASSEKDEKLERKAVAMMRLAEKRAGSDGELLARLGESYFQAGEWKRAGIVFEKARETVGETYRIVRGQAEIALREGKIAHVIHNFAAANRLAETRSLRRWTQGEVEYFSRLNNDEEYMELEISRMNLVDSLAAAKRTALRIAFFAFPLVVVGIYFEDALVADIGWAIAAVALLVWAGMILGSRMLASRIPVELMDE